MPRKESPAPLIVPADTTADDEAPYVVSEDETPLYAKSAREWRDLGDGCYIRRSLPMLADLESWAS